MENRSQRKQIVGAIPDRGRVKIEGAIFSLLYDYDRDKLKALSDQGKIEWFKHRMRFLFINPVKTLWDRNSDAYRLINTPDRSDIREHRGFNLSIFCTVLLGVESYGAFLRGVTGRERENEPNFSAFIQAYMKDWYKCVHVNRSPKHLSALLWDHCRNALTHGFRILEIGIDYVEKEGKEVNYGKVDGIPMINCFKFFNDFTKSIENFYRDLASNSTAKKNFLQTFNAFYPVN